MERNKKIVLTTHANHLLITLFEGNKPFSMDVIPENLEAKEQLGSIYLSKVTDVQKGIEGIFLSLDASSSNDKKAYLPMSRDKVLCANRTVESIAALHKEDQIIVQICSEKLKTKPYTVTANPVLTGQYVVCRLFGHGVKYSRKLEEAARLSIKEALSSFDFPRRRYEFTIRTNAGALTDLTPLKQEIAWFTDIFSHLEDTFSHRPVASCFYQPESRLISCLKDYPIDSYDEIVTEDPALCSELSNIFGSKVRLYQDPLLSLAKLYSIPTHLKEALSRQVWLPSGGYLILEPTEAMVVIDVNSGKASGQKPKRQVKLTVNLEAARELARQLRLRNYSGMIMVDFINMDQKADEEMLLKVLSEELLKDRIHTRLVDLTKLGVVEITRKKTTKPLSTFFQKSLTE